MRKSGLLIVGTLWLAMASVTQAQDEEKIKKLFDTAIAALGGDPFLNVTDIVSEGNLFFFDRDGNSSGLIKYSDWTKLPDKSRNEVGNRKKERDVTVFNLEKSEGWILEGQKPTREATPEEMKGFNAAVKHSFETILRTRHKDPANKVFYLGPGEGADVSLEMVRLLDPENDEVTIYFDRMSGLPAKIEYRTLDRRGVRQRRVDEFSQWLVIQGIKTPMRTDGFLNGRKYSQMFVTKLSYNNNLPDSFFSKPLPPK